MREGRMHNLERQEVTQQQRREPRLRMSKDMKSYKIGLGRIKYYSTLFDYLPLRYHFSVVHGTQCEGKETTLRKLQHLGVSICYTEIARDIRVKHKVHAWQRGKG